MKISREQIDQLCQLARVDLAFEERQRLQRELGRILDYMMLLDRVDAGELDPMVQSIELTGRLREDQPAPGPSREEALRNAPRLVGDYFAVPAVVELTPRGQSQAGSGPPEPAAG